MPQEWCKHPALQGRLHPDHPDDLQVIVHDGGPRITHRRPELLWVTIAACEGDIFTGKVLNQPDQLETVSLGEAIYFLVPKSGQHPVRVTKKYLEERPDWIKRPLLYH